MEQLTLFPSTTHNPDLGSYDYIIVAFSGGKDSLACLLYLLEEGADPEKIELWHHDVDGHGLGQFMDWPCTAYYCKAVAQAFGIPLYFSWKEGGFLGELRRNNSPTRPTWFETPLVTKKTGGAGPAGTRQKFPQVSADLRVRWCSAYLKIDVADKSLCGQARFKQSRTLFVTGERAQESPSRAKYKPFEPHRKDIRDSESARHIDHWRPVHRWDESQVWEIIRRHQVNPHPAYRLGWGRVSCAACIFGSPNQWASLRRVLPQQFHAVAIEEAATGLTIQREHSIVALAGRGAPYSSITPELIHEAQSAIWTGPVFLENWQLPAGAYGEQVGPT